MAQVSAIDPQHGNQKPSCGFPIAKLVVIFPLLTGAVVSACVAPFDCSEIVMGRWLYEHLDPEDVGLADQAYGSYVDLALVQQCSVPRSTIKPDLIILTGNKEHSSAFRKN